MSTCSARRGGAGTPASSSVAAALIGAALLLTGCGTDPGSVAGQARAGDRKGYVSGDGSVQQIAADDRTKPLSVSGTTLDGRAWSSTDEHGKVLVLNVWGSWCGPCVKEAPDLQQVYAQSQERRLPVAFMGLDVKESPESALAFVRARGITYPSLRCDGGVPLLGVNGQAPTVPATLVLDRDGQLASRVLGPVTAATLTGLIDDALGGQTANPAPSAAP